MEITDRLLSHSILTRERERELAYRARAGDKASFDLLVTHNQRLVWSIARRWMPLAEKKGAQMSDLVQEGNLGLMHGIRKFDPDRGYKLTTYATWWITQRIQRFLQEYGTIRTPCHIGARIASLRKLELKDPDATDAQLAAKLKVKEEHIADLRRIDAGTLSLDWKAEGDEGFALIDFLAAQEDTSGESPEDVLLQNAELHDALGRMPERDRRVFELRFGLDGGRERSLEEIGKELHLTRERIRQILNSRLDHLRLELGA